MQLVNNRYRLWLFSGLSFQRISSGNLKEFILTTPWKQNDLNWSHHDKYYPLTLGLNSETFPVELFELCYLEKQSHKCKTKLPTKPSCRTQTALIKTFTVNDSRLIEARLFIWWKKLLSFKRESHSSRATCLFLIPGRANDKSMQLSKLVSDQKFAKKWKCWQIERKS